MGPILSFISRYFLFMGINFEQNQYLVVFFSNKYSSFNTSRDVTYFSNFAGHGPGWGQGQGGSGRHEAVPCPPGGEFQARHG